MALGALLWAACGSDRLSPRVADEIIRGTEGEALGMGLNNAGDVNADGHDDLLFTRAFRSLTVGSGVDLMFGGVRWGGLNTDWSSSGPFLWRIVRVGDVDSDGADDLVFEQTWGPGEDEVADLYLGQSDGLNSVGVLPAWKGVNTTWKVFGVGDINSDGYSDVLASELKTTDLFLLWGGSLSPLEAGQVFTFGSDVLDGQLLNAASVGDVNGDGMDDLVAIHAREQPDGTRLDSLLFMAGARTGPTNGPWSPVTVLAEWVDSDAWGQKVRSMAEDCLLGQLDFNGDGLEDFVAGGMDGLKLFLGRVGESPKPSVWRRGFDQVANLDWEANYDVWHAFCSSMEGGDLDGDGFDDLVIGAPGWNDRRRLERGRVDAYYGGPDGLSAEPVWFAKGKHSGARLGFSLAVIDLDGDGFDDTLVGVPGYRAGKKKPRVGRIDLFRGEPRSSQE